MITTRTYHDNEGPIEIRSGAGGGLTRSSAGNYAGGVIPRSLDSGEFRAVRNRVGDHSQPVAPARQQPSSPVGQPGAGRLRALLPRVISQKIRAAIEQGLVIHIRASGGQPRIVASAYLHSSCAVVIVKCGTPAELDEIMPSIEAEMKHWLAVKAAGGDMEAAI